MSKKIPALKTLMWASVGSSAHVGGSFQRRSYLGRNRGFVKNQACCGSVCVRVRVAKALKAERKAKAKAQPFRQ
jgi:hypothetical protein